MTCLDATATIEIAGETLSSFPSMVAIGSLLAVVIAWELTRDIAGRKYKLLKKHRSLSTMPQLFIFIKFRLFEKNLSLSAIPLFFIFIIILLMSPW